MKRKLTDKERYQEIAEIKDAMLRIEGLIWQLGKIVNKKESEFIDLAKTEIDFIKKMIENIEERANKLLINGQRRLKDK